MPYLSDSEAELVGRFLAAHDDEITDGWDWEQFEVIRAKTREAGRKVTLGESSLQNIADLLDKTENIDLMGTSRLIRDRIRNLNNRIREMLDI